MTSIYIVTCCVVCVCVRYARYSVCALKLLRSVHCDLFSKPKLTASMCSGKNKNNPGPRLEFSSRVAQRGECGGRQPTENISQT